MNHGYLTPVKYSQSTGVMSILFSYPKSCTRPVKLSIQGLQEKLGLSRWTFKNFVYPIITYKSLFVKISCDNSRVFYIFHFFNLSMLSLFLDQKKRLPSGGRVFLLVTPIFAKLWDKNGNFPHYYEICPKIGSKWFNFWYKVSQLWYSANFHEKYE